MTPVGRQNPAANPKIRGAVLLGPHGPQELEVIKNPRVESKPTPRIISPIRNAKFILKFYIRVLSVAKQPVGCDVISDTLT
jgi:hypothetical protein